MKNERSRYKEKIYEQFSRIGKAISNPRRLELLDLLSQSARTVESLAEEAEMTVASTSQHLQILRLAHLVSAEKRGLYVIYSLADRAVYTFFTTLRSFAEDHLAEIDALRHQFLDTREDMEPVSKEELLALMNSSAVRVLDVRPREEYRAGHISGALSLPLDEFEQGLPTLPREKEIVAYCRGPFCILAISAVERLRENGFRARRFDEGIPELRSAGFRITEGEEERQE